MRKHRNKKLGRNDFLKVTYTIPKADFRFLCAKLTDKEPQPNQKVIFKTDYGGKCSFFTRGDELQVKIAKNDRGWILRNFIRNFVKSEGGNLSSINFFTTPFR